MDLKALKDQVEYECPTASAFQHLKQMVQEKAEWLDLSEAVQRQTRDHEQIEKQEEALQAVQTRVREFCQEAQELHAKAADETGELKALLSRA